MLASSQSVNSASTSAHREVFEMAPLPGSSTDAAQSYDYTEGASAIDIQNAVNDSRRSRRESQYSTYYDEDQGAMFSGPGHTVNPSSVSRMSNVEFGRRSSDVWSSRRRRSTDASSQRPLSKRRDSQVSRQTYDREDGAEDASESDDLLSDDGVSTTTNGGRRRRRKSQSPLTRSTVFENLAHLFGRGATAETHTVDGRRFSISGRSNRSRKSSRSRVYSENALDTDEERWGYSSNEEESDEEERIQEQGPDNASIAPSMAYDSEPSSPMEGTQSLPLMAFDPVFGGEGGMEMDTGFTLLSPPPPGPPSRQTIYIEDEDTTIRFIGYQTIAWRVWVWKLGCVLSFGILALVGHWFPALWLRWNAEEKAFIDAHNGFLMVEVCRTSLSTISFLTFCQSAHKAIMLLPIRKLNYPYHITTVFPASIPIVPGSEGPIQPSKGFDEESGVLKHLLIAEYRYTRYAVDPRTGLFYVVRYGILSSLLPLKPNCWTATGRIKAGLQLLM